MKTTRGIRLKGGVAQIPSGWRSYIELEVNRKDPVYHIGKVTEDYEVAVMDYKVQLMRILKDLVVRLERQLP